MGNPLPRNQRRPPRGLLQPPRPQPSPVTRPPRGSLLPQNTHRRPRGVPLPDNPPAQLTPVLTGSDVHSRCGPAGPSPAQGSTAAARTVTAAIFLHALQRDGCLNGRALYGSVAGRADAPAALYGSAAPAACGEGTPRRAAQHRGGHSGKPATAL